MINFSLRGQVKVTDVWQKATDACARRIRLAGFAVEREAKKMCNKGGGRAGPPQIRGVQYYYGEPLNRWVKASPEGSPPYTQTGDLKNSIKTEQAGILTVLVGPSVFYGKFLEFGTKRMAARPFMRPALRAVRDLLPQLFRRLW